ncbi:MAG: type II CAAX endopeptidase family protein [Thermodesulfovibrionales bacterium]
MNEFEKKRGHVRDLVIAYVILIFVGLVTYKALDMLFSVHSYFVGHIAGFVGTGVAIYLLKEKYPLDLLTKIKSRHIFTYILPAVFIDLLCASFPYFIWLGHLETIPKEYNLFVSFSLIENFFFLSYLCLLGPIIEEIFYRGFLYRIIRDKYAVFWGLIVSTGLFYLAHGIDNWTIIISSLIFTYVYEKSGNIWNNIIVHSLTNILWFIFLYWGIKYHLG